MPPRPMRPRFFASPESWRAWLEQHHATDMEVVVGFRRKASRRPSMTWPEAVDQALCFGWIDGIRRRIDDESYSNRFTPRRRGSNWSAVNVKRVGELFRLGLMRPAGLAAFEARQDARTGQYSYERASRDLDALFEARLRGDPAAWRYWQAQAPSYRRVASHWVMSAKQAATRERRLAALIQDSAAGRPIKPLRYGGNG
jgi:uncharacterized protein YdeI (YjbR/CyaY-like superfamily)